MPPGAVVAFRVILAPDINVMTYLLTYLILQGGGSNISKFGPILAFEALQFQKEATHVKSKTHVGSAYLLSKYGVGCSVNSENWGLQNCSQKTGKQNILNLQVRGTALHQKYIRDLVLR